MRTVFAIHIAAIVALAAPAWGISGKVVDTRGKPISGAAVFIANLSSALPETMRMDGSGEFATRFDDDTELPHWPVTYRVLDRYGKPAGGAIVSRQSSWNLKILRTDAQGRFSYALRPGDWGYTHIYDSRGRPLPNSQLLTRTELDIADPKIVTDARGEYAEKPYSAWSTRTWSFAAVADGYSYAAASPKQRSLESLTITLWPEMRLKGEVISEDGKPLAGARVVVEYLQYTDAKADFAAYGPSASALRAEMKGLAAISNKNGSFILRHLPHSDSSSRYSMSLIATAPGRARVRVFLDDESLRPPTIKLPREAKISGKAFLPDKSGVIAEGTPIELWRDGSTLLTIHVDKDGAFEFDKLLPGTIVLAAPVRRLVKGIPVVEERPWVIARTAVDLTAGLTANVELVATRGSLLSGIAVDSGTGKPLASASLALDGPGLNYAADAVTDKNGKFTFRAPAGDLVIRLLIAKGADGKSLYAPIRELAPSVALATVDGEDQTDLKLSFRLDSLRVPGR